MNANRQKSGMAMTGGMRVLVVDHSLVVREWAAYCFSARTSAEVRLAATSAEAIAAVRSEHFDVILIDLALPHADAHFLIRALRAVGHTEPIVAIGASSNVPDALIALREGADAFLEKPLSLAKFQQTLETLPGVWHEDERAMAYARRVVPSSNKRVGLL